VRRSRGSRTSNDLHDRSLSRSIRSIDGRSDKQTHLCNPMMTSDILPFICLHSIPSHVRKVDPPMPDVRRRIADRGSVASGSRKRLRVRLRNSSDVRTFFRALLISQSARASRIGEKARRLCYVTYRREGRKPPLSWRREAEASVANGLHRVYKTSISCAIKARSRRLGSDRYGRIRVRAAQIRDSRERRRRSALNTSLRALIITVRRFAKGVYRERCPVPEKENDGPKEGTADFEQAMEICGESHYCC